MLDLDPPRGWMEVGTDKDYPAFRTHVPREGEGVLSGYLRVMWRGSNWIDVIVEEREQDTPTPDWTPTYGGVVDVSVHPDDAQTMVDTAAAAWLNWARKSKQDSKP